MWGDEKDNKKISVKTTKLSKYINKKVDLLKIDIEGSEQKVLEEIKNKLHMIKQIVMEFHSTPSSRNENNYKIVEKILKENSFKIKTYTKVGNYFSPNLARYLWKTTRVFSVKTWRV